MERNVIGVAFNGLSVVNAGSVMQWDKGQVLDFTDTFPEGTEVQFSAQGRNSETINKVIKDNRVTIPDILLERAGTVFAWVRVINATSETTIKEARIQVKSRARPADYVASEDEQTFREYVEERFGEIEAIAKEGAGAAFEIGNGLKYDKETNTISVDVADRVEEDNTRPITAAAVYAEIGNIEAIMSTI